MPEKKHKELLYEILLKLSVHEELMTRKNDLEVSIFENKFKELTDKLELLLELFTSMDNLIESLSNEQKELSKKCDKLVRPFETVATNKLWVNSNLPMSAFKTPRRVFDVPEDEPEKSGTRRQREDDK